MKKHGKSRGLQRYCCLQCYRTFSSKRKPKIAWIRKAYEDYTVHKQSYKELSKKYGKSGKTLRKLFDEHAGATGEIFQYSEPFALILDATFFGRGYGILMARNLTKVLFWQEIVTESIREYEVCLNQLDAMDYSFSAFVVDGRPGVRQLLMRKHPGTSIQLCQFHQIQIVKRYIPIRAKTEAGKELRKIALGLTKMHEAEFERVLNTWHTQYGDFLKEKTLVFPKSEGSK